MTIIRLHIDDVPAWESHHDLPMLWPWFFRVEAITESRKFFATLFDAADSFQCNLARTKENSYLHAIFGIFEEIRADDFPQQLGEKPDAIFSMSVGEFERDRRFSVEQAARHWKEFFAGIEANDAKGTYQSLEDATRSPLILGGNRTRDALALRSATAALGLRDEQRAAALVQLLMGRPVSRAAKALNVRWMERAAHLPIAEFKERRGIVGRLFGKPR